MTTSVVRTRGLRKVYGSHVALDGVDLDVGHGSVYGLVGPNGFGKTTMLSILTGLRRATGGTVDLDVDRTEIAVLADTPHFEPWLTGAEVVDLARALSAPHLPAERVREALARAGLGDAADRRTGGYSRGMLQRLGLAAAMVGEPKLLVLDEPSSALDPAGRREVLDLVASLRGQATVLFSSHVLGDVQEVCDTVGILREGRLLFEGALDDLLVGHAAPAFAVRLRGGAAAVAEALHRHDWATSVHTPSPGLVDVTVGSLADAETELAGALAAAGARVVSVVPRSADLERIFLELTR